jgi:hypothetical protein
MEAFFTYKVIITIIMALFWSLFFLHKREVRREMIILSIFSLILLPLTISAPSISSQTAATLADMQFADLIFIFATAGIAGVVFHEIFGKHYHRIPKTQKKKAHEHRVMSQYWLLRLFFLVLAFVWTVILLSLFFGLAAPFAVFLASVFVLVYIASHRHDLLVDGLMSGALTAFLVLLGGAVAGLFATPEGLMTLLLIAGALGLALGPAYEYVRRFELI